MGERNLEVPEFPVWNDADPAASLQAIYNFADNRARSTIDWYFRRKGWRAAGAKVLRSAAIVLIGLGGLIPIARGVFMAAGSAVQGSAGATDLGELGYVAFGLAAILLAFDHFFGLSSGWMRFVTNGLSLQKLLTEFQLDWTIARSRVAGRAAAPSEIEAMLLRVKTFMLAVAEIIRQETQSWATELQTNLAELDRTARVQAEFSRPGIIDLTVPNGTLAESDIAVSLDSVEKERFKGAKCQLANVSPGAHVLSVRARLNGKDATASSGVQVSPNSIANVSLPLE